MKVKLVLEIATCILLSIILMMVMPSLAIRDVALQEQLGVYQTVPLDIEGGATSYKKFLTNLRQKFEGPLKACGLPVTRDTLPKGGEYVLADLKISSTEWVTVALKVTDLYLVAYRVNKLYNGTYEAKFLKEPDIDFAKAHLFRDGEQIKLDYDSNYANIERYAGSSRKKIKLGLHDLRKKIKAFYDDDDEAVVTPAKIAEFFLVAIQMVSEAARYSYIEDKVVKHADFKPDDKMIDLQKNWQKTSDAVRAAEAKNQCGSKEVKGIKKDTKLLKNLR